MIALLFWEVLQECERRGAQILAVICDGHPSNRSFMKLISRNNDPLDGYFTASNPHAHERQILLCSDPSHLLKVIR